MKPVIYALTLKIITAVMPLPHGRRRCRRLIFGRRFCQCLLIQEKGTITKVMSSSFLPSICRR
jgi:hypothetical protein